MGTGTDVIGECFA